jgi:tetratricopeptide (TPR) repeat protein
MKSRIDVFISSTSYDLPDHRAAVIEVLNRYKLQPNGMEYWNVKGEDPVALCKRQVFDSEVFIGIYAYRYGWCPDGGKSITEMEYDWAGAVIRDGKPIPRLCFIIDKTHAITADMMEANKQTELDAFKTRVKAQHVGFFKNADDLGKQVATALAEYLQTQDTSLKCNYVPAPPIFAGRVDDLARLEIALTTGSEKVAITAVKGIGGIGKTTLAKQFGHGYGDFGLRLWAELGQNFSESLEPTILRRWARELSGRELSAELQIAQLYAEVSAMVNAALHGDCPEPSLLIIDDVWRDTVEAARRLLAVVPDARILITTRTEDVAAALDAETQQLEYLSDKEGAELLLAHLEKAKVANVANYRAELEQLSKALGGHALALNLVARQLRRHFTPTRLRELTETYQRGLDAGDDFRKLKLDDADAKSKVDSVTQALRLTYDALGGSDVETKALRQKQFRALGALPPDISFRSRHLFALWEAEDDDAVADFVAEGLLTPIADKEDQYLQHRLLRGYARALLNDAKELDDSTDRHRKYLIDLANSVFHNKKPETWKQLDDDLEQIHALGNELTTLLSGTTDEAKQDDILKAISDEGKIKDASSELLAICEDFAFAVYWYIFRRYISTEGRRWLWAGLVGGSARNSQDKVGSFANHLGLWYVNHGDRIEALQYYERALILRREVGDKRGEAQLLNNIGKVYRALGDHVKALQYYERALILRREVGDKGGEGVTLNNIGKVYEDNLHQYDKALEYYTKSLALKHEVGDKGGEGVTLNNIGEVYRQLGENNMALDFYTRSLALKHEVGDKGGEGVTLNNIGEVYRQLGENNMALDFYGQSLQLRIAVQDPNGEAITRSNIAITLWEQGEREEARMYMQTARDLKARIGMSTASQDAQLAEWRKEMGE